MPGSVPERPVLGDGWHAVDVTRDPAMTADAANPAQPPAWPADFHVTGVHATLLANGDADLFSALYGDPVTMRHVAPVLDRHAATRAFAAARRQMRAEPPIARYWCLDTVSGSQGLLSLVPDADGRAAETGLLLPPAAQGRGVATAVLGHLCDAVLDTGAFDALWTRHRVGHVAAVGLMQRLGFVPGTAAHGWRHWRLDRLTWRALVDDRPAG